MLPESGKPSCIDLLLTNRPKNSQSSPVAETELSDSRKMTVTIMKTSLEKLNAKVTYEIFRTKL